MPFDITEFSSQLSRRGVQKPSHYQLLITPPATIETPVVRDFIFRANSANLPGFNIGYDDIKHKGYGLGEKRANTISFEDITVTVIVDGQGETKKFFNDWMELILPTNDGVHGTSNVEMFEYPVNYYGGIEITMFDGTGVAHTNWSFKDCFPISVGAVQVSWESTDTIFVLPISFAYRSYKMEQQHASRI